MSLSFYKKQWRRLGGGARCCTSPIPRKERKKSKESTLLFFKISNSEKTLKGGTLMIFALHPLHSGPQPTPLEMVKKYCHQISQRSKMLQTSLYIIEEWLNLINWKNIFTYLMKKRKNKIENYFFYFYST